MSSRVHSFDVFDTCLVRVFLRPRDLFFELAARALAEVRSPDSFGLPEISELARGRIEAETEAMAAVDSQEATLVQIYDHMPSLAAWGIDRDRMRALELDLEAESVRPIATTKRRIQQLRKAGERIVFASDMYLPAETIHSMLLQSGIAAAGDGLYVSSELGVTKRTGDLFRLIMEQEGVAAADLHHLGDSLLGDYVPARRLGLQAELFADSQPTRFERAIAGGAGDAPWVSARIAGISRATRLAHVPDHEQVIPGMGAIAANVVAPLLCGFVLWSLQQAAARDTERLYFVARDGQVLLRIAQAVAAHVPTPELRYLYGSRQAWYLPSVENASRTDLAFAVLEGQSRSPRAMLSKLGLTPEVVREQLAEFGFDLSSYDEQLDEAGIEQFWAFLLSGSVAALILETAHEARRAATEYFRQEGLLEDDRWSLVDVGWTLRTQASLNKMLAAAGQRHVDGYYLGVTELRFGATEYGRAQGYFVEEVERRLNPGATPIFENKGFVDDVLIQADHGPTTGYAWKGDAAEPTLGPAALSSPRMAMLAVMQETAVAFVTELAKAGLTDEIPALKQASRLTTDMFFAHPTAGDARAFAWASLTPDPNNDRSVPLVRKLGVRTLARIARDLIKRTRRSTAISDDGKTVPRVFYKDAAWGFSWLEGSVAVSGPPAKLALWAYRALRRLDQNRQNVLAAVVRSLHPIMRRFGR